MPQGLMITSGLRRDFDQFQDSKKNYEEAGRCYREALYIFHHLRRTPHTGHRVRNFLDTKVVQVPTVRYLVPSPTYGTSSAVS